MAHVGLFIFIGRKSPVSKKKREISHFFEFFSFFLQKPIDKGRKMRYNPNEPNGSQRFGGQNEVKKHRILFNDPKLR